jgi:methionyl aminopeptidase
VLRRKTRGEIDAIRAACAIVCRTQQHLRAHIRPGVTTGELDRLAEQLIRASGAVPAFKGYNGYPSTICASINAQIVHGIPDGTALASGDLISIDVGVRLNGYHGDGAFTVALAPVEPRVQHLIDATSRCLDLAIEQARPGRFLSDISHAVESHAVGAGLSVVRQFGGHGIGRQLHEAPHINNYGPPGQGPRLEPGLVLAIEPILSLGSSQPHTGDDGWTTTTADGSPAAHFEHTVVVTVGDPEILTLSATA